METAAAAMLEAGVGRFSRAPALAAALLAEMWAPLAVALAALATLPSLLRRLQVIVLRLRSRGKEVIQSHISTYYSSGDEATTRTTRTRAARMMRRPGRPTRKMMTRGYGGSGTSSRGARTAAAAAASPGATPWSRPGRACPAASPAAGSAPPAREKALDSQPQPPEPGSPRSGCGAPARPAGAATHGGAPMKAAATLDQPRRRRTWSSAGGATTRVRRAGAGVALCTASETERNGTAVGTGTEERWWWV